MRLLKKLKLQVCDPTDPGTWEWRFFETSSLPAEAPWPRQRRDVYFPASEAAGLKLRNGQGRLEMKFRTQSSDASASLPGPAECWVKSMHGGCLASPTAQVEAAQVDAGACALAAAKSAQELFELGHGHPVPVRVMCCKNRTYDSHGEVVDCVFAAYIDGFPSRPVLVERYRSLCIEGPSLARVAESVQRLGPLPQGAIVGGYPSMVQDIARRALSQAKVSSSPGVASTPAPEAQIRTYRVLKSGDVRDAPNSNACEVSRLTKGSVVKVSRELTVDGRVWVLLHMFGQEYPPQQCWTSLTKKSGEVKLERVPEAMELP
eukprot:TRINITY_DN95796_c0_g1_i1.p1 TRINITY_DN95796_c0_g1~~TRINITY_DN95796_c0_g1_i1.p1  ORF type:complete len:318 (+),score=50.45 TRINITY_DN95796_c0_g1_i1:177-1130(+)